MGFHILHIFIFSSFLSFYALKHQFLNDELKSLLNLSLVLLENLYLSFFLGLLENLHISLMFLALLENLYLVFLALLEILNLVFLDLVCWRTCIFHFSGFILESVSFMFWFY